MPPSVDRLLHTLARLNTRNLAVHTGNRTANGIVLFNSVLLFFSDAGSQALDSLRQSGAKSIDLTGQRRVNLINILVSIVNESHQSGNSLIEGAAEFMNSVVELSNLCSKLSILVGQLSSDSVKLGVDLFDKINTSSTALVLLGETLTFLMNRMRKYLMDAESDD